MDADRFGLQAHGAAVDGGDDAFDRQPQHAFGDFVRVVQHGAGFATRHQRALRRVGAVGKSFGNHAHTHLVGPPQERRSGERDQAQGGIDLAHGSQHVARLTLVVRDGVVKRAVRLDVAHLRAGCRGQPLQRADLVDDVGDQVGAVDVLVAAAEAGEIRIRHVGADRNAPRRRQTQRAQDAGRVSRVEAAGHVGAAHDVEHRGVVAHPPGAQALAEVAVEVDIPRIHRQPRK